MLQLSFLQVMFVGFNKLGNMWTSSPCTPDVIAKAVDDAVTVGSSVCSYSHNSIVKQHYIIQRD